MEPRVTLEIGAAMRVGDDGVLTGGRVFDGRANPFRPVVELGRNGPDLDVPAAPGCDLLDVQRERAARDNDSGGMAASTMSGTWFRTCRLRARLEWPGAA
jgi:hypothetical protein